MKIKAASIFSVGALALTLGYGFLTVNSQSAPLFTKNGQTVTITASTTLDVETLTQGGGVTATSTQSSSALLATAIDTENVVDITLTQGSGTLTLPATSTMSAIAPHTGDTRTIYIRNATTTAGINLTIAGGTGMTVKRAASTTAMLIGDTDGSNTMKVDFVRKADSNFNVLLTKFED